MGQSEEDSAVSFPCFRIENTRVCFQAAGKNCVRKIALNNTTKRKTALNGRFFKALLVIPPGPGALSTLRPRIMLELPWGWSVWLHLRVRKSTLASPYQQSQWLPGSTDRLPAEIEPPNSPQGLWLSRRPKELVLLVWPRGLRLGDSHHPSGQLPRDWSSGSRFYSELFHWLFLHSLRRLDTDICRPLKPAFKRVPAGSVTAFLVDFSDIRHSIAGLGSHGSDTWGGRCQSFWDSA